MGSFGSHGSHVSLGSPGPPGSLWSWVSLVSGVKCNTDSLNRSVKIIEIFYFRIFANDMAPCVKNVWLPVLQGLEVGELQLVKVPQLLAHSGGVLWRRGWRTPRGDKYNCALCSIT